MKTFNFKSTLFLFLIIFIAQCGSAYGVVISTYSRNEEIATPKKADACNELKEQHLHDARVISAMEEYCK